MILHETDIPQFPNNEPCYDITRFTTDFFEPTVHNNVQYPFAIPGG